MKSKAEERTSRGYGTAPDTGSRRGTNDYSTTTQTQNHDRAMRDNQQPPESNYEKTIETIQKALMILIKCIKLMLKPEV